MSFAEMSLLLVLLCSAIHKNQCCNLHSLDIISAHFQPCTSHSRVHGKYSLDPKPLRAVGKSVMPSLVSLPRHTRRRFLLLLPLLVVREHCNLPNLQTLELIKGGPFLEPIKFIFSLERGGNLQKINILIFFHDEFFFF